MNLPTFLKAVDEAVNKLSSEDLALFVHDLARSLPEKHRDEFLTRICKTNTKTSQDAVMPTELKEKSVWFQEKLNAIADETFCLKGSINEEYDDWYNNDEDEFIFDDPGHVCKTIEQTVQFVHACVDNACYNDAYETARQLLPLQIAVTGDYMDYAGGKLSLEDILNHDLADFDYRQLVIDSLYAAYCSRPLEERPEALFNLLLQSESRDITLEAVMQLGEFDQQSEFLLLWIDYLGQHEGPTAENFLIEAIGLSNDPALYLDTARKFHTQHPGLYTLELTRLHSIGDFEGLFEVGKEAVTQMDIKYVERSKSALFGAEGALHLDRQTDAEKFWLEAFRSETTPTSLLRLAAECTDFSVYRKEVKDICECLLEDNIKRPYVFGECQENCLSKQTYFTLDFLLGDFDYVIEKAMNVKEALGWSYTFMKRGMAMLMLLLYNGTELGRGCTEMCRMTASDISFTSGKYVNGLIHTVDTNDTIAFWYCFRKWKLTVGITDEQRGQIIEKLENWISMRIQGIMEANRRKYYYECAAYVAALGEVKESLGRQNGKQELMKSYKAKYPRRTAFHGELMSFGMKKP